MHPEAKPQASGGWRITSAALGRDYEEDLSLHPEGIRDFGPEKGLTPIDVVMKYGSASTAPEALEWLCAQMGRDPQDFGWKKGRAKRCKSPKTPKGSANAQGQVAGASMPLNGAAASPLKGCFRIDEQGVFFQPPADKEGNEPPEQWVCAPLRIVVATRDEHSDNHGHLLEFTDRYGHPQQWAMPLSLLEEPKEYRKVLRRRGLVINGNANKVLQTYLDVSNSDHWALCVDRVGWYQDAYVLPGETVGKQGTERIVLQTLDHTSEGYRQCGDLDGWRREVSSLCVGNSRLLLAVSAGFAAPLLALLGEESGGIHFRGNSSEGKTSTLLVAATVWGEPGRIERWRTTMNALEGVALAHNDNLLCLDELKELDPREAGATAYMLANGTGKRRGRPDGGTRPRLAWCQRQ